MLAEHGAARLPEGHVLLGCARVGLSTETARGVRSLVRNGIDWSRVLQLAREHGIVPLLYWHLSRLDPDEIPQPLIEHLRERFHANAARNLLLARELLQLLDAFEARGVAAVPYKGPTLAVSVYGNLALREFCDLDILIRTGDLATAGDILVSRSYRPRFEPTRPQQRLFLRFQSEQAFDEPGGRWTVELQWDIAPRFFTFPFGFEELGGRLEELSLAGRSVPSLAPETLLLVLCVHGCKHLWARLGWLCDVAELIRRRPELDWDRLAADARRRGGERMLGLGLCLAHELLGATVPEQVVRRAREDAAVASLAAQVSRRLFRQAHGSSTILRAARFHLRSRERLRDRIRYSLRLMLNPAVGDWVLVRLPAFLSFFYYVLRPLRLVRKYGLGR